jgi:hypothetical protein
MVAVDQVGIAAPKDLVVVLPTSGSELTLTPESLLPEAAEAVAVRLGARVARVATPLVARVFLARDRVVGVELQIVEVLPGLQMEDSLEPPPEALPMVVAVVTAASPAVAVVAVAGMAAVVVAAMTTPAVPTVAVVAVAPPTPAPSMSQASLTRPVPTGVMAE